ncbi:MAG: hypothetical protein QM654_16400 [Dysgonamonadaceae bacterium]
MQEKEQKISPIKQRILYFVDTLNISKRDFYSIIGVSRGTLESKTGITEDVVAKFIAVYKQVNIEWLITGKGKMLNEDSKSTNESSSLDSLNLIKRFEELIIENTLLKRELEDLKRGRGSDPCQKLKK